MNKWIAILVIAVLAVVVVVTGYSLWQQTNKLGEAESEIVALEGNVATLEGTISTLEANVSTLEGSVSTLETDLAESEATVSTLEADLETANSRVTSLEEDVKTQQTINLSLSAELKKVKDPRHFSSLTELTDWLQQDDTNTKYADKSNAQKAFILQVRALRDGYLLTSWIFDRNDGMSYAFIGDKFYFVYPENDDTLAGGATIQPLPSRPLPLD